MENAKAREFVQKIRGLWREQKNREFIYLEAMKKDGMGPMRKMLAQGHFSALLCQKEICSIYDYFKCFFNDRELGDLNEVKVNEGHLMQEIEGKEQVVGFLRNNEGLVLQSYKSIIKHLDLEAEVRQTLNQHLDRISELYEILSKQGNIKLKSLNVG